MWQVLLVLVFVSLLVPFAAASLGLGHTVIVGNDAPVCFYHVADKEDGLGDQIVKVFVERGGDLSVELAVRGPLRSDKEGIPILQPPPQDLKVDEKIQVQPNHKELLANDEVAEHFGESYAFGFLAEEGLYEICFRNSERRAPKKYVHFSIGSLEDESMGQQAAEADWSNLKKSTDPDLYKEEMAAGAQIDVPKIVDSIGRLSMDLTFIERKQARDRKRLAMHSAMNERNHRSMMFSSLVETMIFVGVTAFQLFFVRRWFGRKGARAKGPAPSSWA